MSNLLIGISNLARFYKPENYKTFSPYQMLKCTTMDSFTALMMELEEGNNKVIISVLENIIVDAARTAKDEVTREKQVTDSIETAMKLIGRTATRLPDSHFCLVSPILRPAVDWYQKMQVIIDQEIRKQSVNLFSKKATRMDCMCVSLQQFEKDVIHLTEASGQIFIESMLKKAEEIFTATNIDSDEETGESSGDQYGKLVAVLKTRFEADNLMFARLREEIDSTANRSREDRIVITGITCKTPLPRESRPRIEKLKELAYEVFEAIKPGFKGKILYASQGKNNEHMLPMVEVKLDKVEHAVEIRKAFAEKRKKDKMTGCLEKIFMANSINVGTRVRIEILKAIAKKITNDNEQAYVVSFISRPVMHIKLKSDKNGFPSKSYTFIDAVKQFGANLIQDDLLAAYAKAGTAFKGQLEQNFVVLKEDDAEAAQTNFHKARIDRGRGRPGGTYRGRGRGRGHGEANEVNRELVGNRGTKRAGDEGESSSSASKK
jgi:hypothetical protein